MSIKSKLKLFNFGENIIFYSDNESNKKDFDNKEFILNKLHKNELTIKSNPKSIFSPKNKKKKKDPNFSKIIEKLKKSTKKNKKNPKKFQNEIQITKKTSIEVTLNKEKKSSKLLRKQNIEKVSMFIDEDQSEECSSPVFYLNFFIFFYNIQYYLTNYVLNLIFYFKKDLIF